MDETLAPGRDDHSATATVAPAPRPRGRHAAPRPTRDARWWALRIAREGGIILGIALAASILVRLVIAQPVYVPGDAMSPTLNAGDRVLLARGPFALAVPARGDVVAFADPGGWQEIDSAPESGLATAFAVLGLAPMRTADVVMRVIAVGGDRIKCCDSQGRLVINGEALDESYLPQGTATDQIAFNVVVPADSYFVLGDNRASARDSRYHLSDNSGAIARSDIAGRILMRLWPPRTLGAPAAFDTIPEPKPAS